jgi:hypothetical protein
MAWFRASCFVAAMCFGGTHPRSPTLCSLLAGDTPHATREIAAGDESDPHTAGRRSGPILTLEETRYEFGRLDVGEDGEHAFVLTNVGDEPLTLTQRGSTCGCCTCVCSVRLPAGGIAPGESGHVVLGWQSRLYVGSFRQTARISTNDPQHPDVTLSIAGRFTGPVGVVPSQVTLGTVRAGESATSELRLYNYTSEPLDITRCEVSDPEMAGHFDLKWEPLSAEQVREEGEARNGYRVRIALQPSLPVGAFQETIMLHTSSKSASCVKVLVKGIVADEISIAGRGWNAQSQVLTIGDVARNEGVDWPLLIVVRGPHARHARFTPLRSSPSWLTVELEPARYVEEKGVSLTRMRVRIAPDAAPPAHGQEPPGELGRITLQVDPPELSDLSLQVRFRVVE